MSQLELKLLGRIDGPSVVPADEINKISSYREACVACWLHRRVKSMTKATLAEVTGMHPSHLSDYLNPSGVDGRGRDLREMPGKYVPAFEHAAGNTFVSQWLAVQSKLTVLEAMIAARDAA